MLVDISNSLRIHQCNNDNSENCKGHTKASLNHQKRTSMNGIKLINIVSRAQGKRIVSNEFDMENLQEYPTYTHSKLYNVKDEAILPFYSPKMLTAKDKCGSSTDSIDLTKRISFVRNAIKKYSKPVSLSLKFASTADSLKTSLFGPLGKNGEIDPINNCFIHLPTESRLKFGYLELDVNEYGKVNLKELPRDDVVNNFDMDETNEDECMELLQDQIEDLNIAKETKREFLLSSSPIKRRILEPITTSPIRKQFNDETIGNISFTKRSPSKEKLVQHVLKVGSSPAKLNSSRQRKKKTNYSKWDKSMTIGAKAIMKMVDDSLVSSDTELYNLSHSFMTKNGQVIPGRNNSTEHEFAFNINADDLTNALSSGDGCNVFFDEMQNSLTSKLKGISI